MNALVTSFSALADPTRLAIVEQLMDAGETAAGDLVSGSGMTAPAISRHLKILRSAGLIAQRAEGKRRLYSMRTDGLCAIAEWTNSRREFWENSLDRLAAAIAKDAENFND